MISSLDEYIYTAEKNEPEVSALQQGRKSSHLGSWGDIYDAVLAIPLLKKPARNVS